MKKEEPVEEEKTKLEPEDPELSEWVIAPRVDSSTEESDDEPDPESEGDDQDDDEGAEGSPIDPKVTKRVVRGLFYQRVNVLMSLAGEDGD